MIKHKVYFFALTITLLNSAMFFTGCAQSETPETTQNESQTLYTCGMHPNVIQEGPGNCPICGMKLTPLNGDAESTTSVEKNDTGNKEILYWRAPMDPSYISSKPGKSPMGMDLVPVYAGEESFGSTVKISPVVEQNMGVRTAEVTRRDLYRKIRTVGRVDYDERLISHIHTKFSGWVEKAHVNTTGGKVSRGEPLVDIYSPQLVTAQQEYLDAYNSLHNAGNQITDAVRKNLAAMMQSSRIRLEYFDISRNQIRKLEETGNVTKTVTIQSPFTGYVMEKQVLDGMEVKPGMRMYTIVDLSNIWVYADIYEFELPWLETGQSARVTLSYMPGTTLEGTVDYIYPYLDSKSRTVKARLVFPNPNLTLKPGMYANVDIQSSPVKNAVAVPLEAVLFTGERALVFVALGEGRFAPREVTVGVESGDGYYEIKSGISAGETIVTSGQFLLDSESRLREGLAKMLGNRQSADPPAGVDHSDHIHTAEEDDDAHHREFGHLGAEGKITTYTCPMESHAYVKLAEPGECPDCGMTLVEKQLEDDPEGDWYTCPMDSHAHVVQSEPGKCPVCEMRLVPFEPQWH